MEGSPSLRPRDVDDVTSGRKRKKEVQILTLDNMRNNRWTGTFLASSQSWLDVSHDEKIPC